MGTYINKGNEGFKCALDGVYIDRTGMIEVLNKTLNTELRFTCVTRSRRFGKTMAIDMLCAYYDKSCDSRELFEGLSISKEEKDKDGKVIDKQYEKHLNKYPVLNLDVTDFITKYSGDVNIIKSIQEEIIEELLSAFPNVERSATDDLMNILIKVNEHTGEKFIMLIDEWDAICREFSDNPAVMDEYIKLLRRLFKGSKSKDVFAGAYLTGILPIKKYNTQSALNNIEEYSVVKPGMLDKYFGFTSAEVAELAKGSAVSAEELKTWYDGYQIGKMSSVYNPYSVVRAIANEECNSYWSSTSAYDAVSTYIEMNFEGLKDDIIHMLAGGRCYVDTTGFTNDIHDIRTKDDVFTVLIHLGYLSYDRKEEECYIPNKEVRMEMVNAVRGCKWNVAKALVESKKLVQATLAGNEEAVARGIELAHDQNTSILSYNDENSLACVISIAYYHAMNDYIIHREYASGKGFADLVFIPRRNVDKPAMVVELKCGLANSPRSSATAAIGQIKQKNYPAKLAEYMDSTKGANILLVGINYNKKSKRHTCKIEHWAK